MYYKREVFVMNDIYGQPYEDYGCNNTSHKKPYPQHPSKKTEQCKQPDQCKKPCGTVFRVFIPAGASIELLNLVELTSPSGICLIVRLPFLCKECKECKPHHDYNSLFDTIKSLGGTIEAVE
jgi:hypothetical protein